MCFLCVTVGAGGGSSSSQSHLPVKAQTTAGIISKTTSTVAQKRVAHTPTMKVSPVFTLLTIIHRLGKFISLLLAFAEQLVDAPHHTHRVWSQNPHQHPPALPQHFYRRMCQVLSIRGRCLPDGTKGSSLQGGGGCWCFYHSLFSLSGP